MKPNMIEVNEQNRTYWFNNDLSFTVNHVTKFADSETTHRLEDAFGKKYIIPKNFIAIEIDVKEWTL